MQKIYQFVLIALIILTLYLEYILNNEKKNITKYHEAVFIVKTELKC